jgi:hypothetical protein
MVRVATAKVHLMAEQRASVRSGAIPAEERGFPDRFVHTCEPILNLMKGVAMMTQCPVCRARFAAAGQAERQWLEWHMARSHGIQRMQMVAGWPLRSAPASGRPAA